VPARIHHRAPRAEIDSCHSGREGTLGPREKGASPILLRWSGDARPPGWLGSRKRLVLAGGWSGAAWRRPSSRCRCAPRPSGRRCAPPAPLLAALAPLSALVAAPSPTLKGCAAARCRCAPPLTAGPSRDVWPGVGAAAGLPGPHGRRARVAGYRGRVSCLRRIASCAGWPAFGGATRAGVSRSSRGRESASTCADSVELRPRKAAASRSRRAERLPPGRPGLAASSSRWTHLSDSGARAVQRRRSSGPVDVDDILRAVSTDLGCKKSRRLRVGSGAATLERSDGGRGWPGRPSSPSAEGATVSGGRDPGVSAGCRPSRGSTLLGCVHQLIAGLAYRVPGVRKSSHARPG